MLAVEQLGDHRQPGGLADLGEDLQAGDAEPLEGERRRARLEGAAAQHRRAGRADRLGDGQRPLARLDRARPGDQAERLAAADNAPVDLERRGLVVGELGRGELVRARDRHHTIHAGHALQPELADALGVADRPDGGRELARHRQHVDAGGLEPGDDRADLILGRAGGHDDHHRRGSYDGGS